MKYVRWLDLPDGATKEVHVEDAAFEEDSTAGRAGLTRNAKNLGTGVLKVFGEMASYKA